MTPATLKTILTTAPMIFQGASKLLNLIRAREPEHAGSAETLPVTIEGLKQQIKMLEAGLEENYQSDVEQIRLIQELAKQNESLAKTLNQTYRRLIILTSLSVIALSMSGLAIILLLTR